MPTNELSDVYVIADDYIEARAELDPINATAWGVPGYDTRLGDLSPDGWEARAALDRRTLERLAGVEGTAGGALHDADRVAMAYLRDRLELGLELHDAGEHLRGVRNLGSHIQSVRQVFDLMPHETREQVEVVSRRMAAVPDAIDGLVASLRTGMARGLVAARRQAVEAAKQCATWSGADGQGFFGTLAAGCAAVDGVDGTLVDELDVAAVSAEAAYERLGAFLRDEYAPAASEVDAVGADRYRLFARSFLGADLDLEATYAWGWDELARIEDTMRGVADRILPGASIAEAIDHLEAEDQELAIEGEDNLRAWLQDLMDRTIAELDGTHFDIPAPVRRVEAMIAPPGGAAAMYYTGPSEDFSRPGRTWYPTLGKTRFPLWGEVSIAYHEGVPGHHLQIGQVRYLRDRLSRHQRLVNNSGHAEGWALYAERLMDELGYLEEPAFELGMLRAQAMRAVRVIVDIGMHLELPLPAGQDFHPGERWTPELGQVFVDERSRFPADFMASEVVRYLGMPGQAISYKVGEKVWLEARAEAEQRHGQAFDLKAWHAYALDLGPLGLDQLARELARF